MLWSVHTHVCVFLLNAHKNPGKFYKWMKLSGMTDAGKNLTGFGADGVGDMIS